MLPLYALVSSAVATGAAAEGSGPRIVGDTAPRRAAIAAGLGGSWIVGDNAAGYGGALSERIVVDLATGDLIAFTVELDHARHALVDAGAYFPEAPIPAGALTGFRDYLVIDAGFRLGIPVGDPRARRSDRVRGVPFVRIGVGLALTSTLLDAPGFDGRVAMRSNTAWFAPSLSAGAEVRIRPWISLLPHMKTQVQVFEDTAESVGGPTRVAAEWRFQPALDVSIHF
ncbi:MAG: hypothetical protein Q8P41_24510 [Pseudomonadota bacterium]|nr:hypothetical protein [Pseudomonadota bacterium]